MPLPLTVSRSSKIQIGFTFLVPAYPGCPGKEAVKWLLLLFSLITSFNLRLNPVYHHDTFFIISHCELCLLRFFSSELNEYVILCWDVFWTRWSCPLEA